MPFTDELVSAVEVLYSPEVEATTGVGHAALAALVLGIPSAIALLIEARLLLLVRRVGRDRMVSVALLGLAGAFVVGGALPLLLPLVFTVAFPLQGVATGAAEAGLVARDPENTDRVLARWATFAALGDLLGPLMCAGAAALGLGWQASYFLAAGWLVVHAGASWWAGRAPQEAEAEEEELPEDLRSLVAGLWHDRTLTWALLVATACSFMDETLIVFGSLWLEQEGVTAADRNLAFTACAAGVAAASLFVEPLVARFPAHRVLAWSSVGCAAAYAWWIVDPGVLPLLVVGVLTAPLYPLAEARAYRAGAPDRVAAASGVVAWVDVAIFIGVGLVADAWGLEAALWVLIAEPVVLFAAAVTDGRARATLAGAG